MTDELPGADPPRAELPRADLLRAERLTRLFKIGGTLSPRTLHAVDDVSFTIGEREIVALAGESGSGKSTIARMLAQVYKPTSGEVFFEGKPLSSMTRTPSCCCPRCPTRGPRCPWRRRPTGASRPGSSTRPPAAGSAGAAR